MKSSFWAFSEMSSMRLLSWRSTPQGSLVPVVIYLPGVPDLCPSNDGPLGGLTLCQLLSCLFSAPNSLLVWCPWKPCWSFARWGGEWVLPVGCREAETGGGTQDLLLWLVSFLCLSLTKHLGSGSGSSSCSNSQIQFVVFFHTC